MTEWNSHVALIFEVLYCTSNFAEHHLAQHIIFLYGNFHRLVHISWCKSIVTYGESTVVNNHLFRYRVYQILSEHGIEKPRSAILRRDTPESKTSLCFDLHFLML